MAPAVSLVPSAGRLSDQSLITALKSVLLVLPGKSSLMATTAHSTRRFDQIERRTERAGFATETDLVVGDVTLPPTGYQSRFSNSLSCPDLEFVPLTNVEITSLVDGRVSERPFVVLSKAHIRIHTKAHIRIAYPFRIERRPVGPSRDGTMIASTGGEIRRSASIATS